MCTYADSNCHDGIERTLTVSPFATSSRPLTVTIDSYIAIHTLRGHHCTASTTSELTSLLRRRLTSLSTGFYSFVLTTNLTLLYSWMCTLRADQLTRNLWTRLVPSPRSDLQVSHDLSLQPSDACFRAYSP